MSTTFNIRNVASRTFADHSRPSQTISSYSLNSLPSGTDNQQWKIVLDNKPSTTPLHTIFGLADGGHFVTVDSTGRLVVTASQDTARLFELIAKDIGTSPGRYIIRDSISGLVWTLPATNLKTAVTLANYDGNTNQTWSLQPVV